jgi:hypothetical protein
MSEFDDFESAFGSPAKSSETFCYFNVFLEGRFFDPTSREAQAANTKFSKPIAKMIKLNALPDAKKRELGYRVLIEVSLIGWQGVTAAHIKHGEVTEQEKITPIDCTPDNALAFFKKYPRFAQSFYEDCSDISNFGIAPADEDDAKN